MSKWVMNPQKVDKCLECHEERKLNQSQICNICYWKNVEREKEFLRNLNGGIWR